MSRALLVCFRRTGRLKKAALAQADGRIDSVRADVEGVHTEIDGLRGDVKKAAEAAEASTQKVAELAERVAQLQDGADGNGDLAELQSAINTHSASGDNFIGRFVSARQD